MVRKQTASQNNWLYQEQDGGKLLFRKSIHLGITAPMWAECTNEEKIKWEIDNPTLVEGYEDSNETEEVTE